MNRRQFLKTSAGAAALLSFRRRALAFQTSPGLAKFGPQQPLRTFTSADALPLAAKDGTRIHAGLAAEHYTINIGEFEDQLHPALGPTKLWGYFQGPSSKKHLGGTIVAQKNTPVQITFVNQLPPTHILPVDTTDFFRDAGSLQNKVAVHLHGGFIPWISDGGPYDWFTPTAVGPSFKNNTTLAPGGDPIWGSLPPGSAEYYWNNQQSARLLWYHDHAHDLTRINAYAGIATGYVLRDPFENNLISKGYLPGLGTAAEIPLVFQDKIFVGENIEERDPSWPGPTAPGSLWYPHTYEWAGPSARWDRFESPFAPSGPGNPQEVADPSVVPEMFGDTMLVNGTVYPFFRVQPRRYRFRVLNACNSRFLNLMLLVRDGTTEGVTLQPNGEMDPNGLPVLVPRNAAGPAMVQIGTEGGFLPAPVIFNSPPRPIGFNTTPGPTFGNANRYNLLLAPAERADVVIDFKDFAGQTLLLYSDTPAPFPVGDNRNDFFYGMPDLTGIGGSAGPAAGYGPNTRTLLQIQVDPTGPADAVPFTTWLSQIKTQLASRSAELVGPSATGAPRRVLTLNEASDQWGRLIQMIGTNVVTYAPDFYGKFLEDSATEVVNAGATEVWEIYNLTGDTHPLHFHLVNVQILNRQPFDPAQFPNAVFTGPARSPDLNERGWKETVRMNPGEVTRVIMRFDLPHCPFTLPNSDRSTLGLPAPPSGKIYHEYVYHCHILEHEEHDMMRPLVVVGPSNP